MQYCLLCKRNSTWEDVMVLAMLDDQNVVVGKRRRRYALCAYCKEQPESFSHVHQLLMQDELVQQEKARST